MKNETLLPIVPQNMLHQFPITNPNLTIYDFYPVPPSIENDMLYGDEEEEQENDMLSGDE